ncbi:MAG: hypothetical protein AAF658_14120, partial [Myxococcota bacterium]
MTISALTPATGVARILADSTPGEKVDVLTAPPALPRELPKAATEGLRNEPAQTAGLKRPAPGRPRSQDVPPRIGPLPPPPELPAEQVDVERLYDEASPDPFRFFDRVHRENASAHSIPREEVATWAAQQGQRTELALEPLRGTINALMPSFLGTTVPTQSYDFGDWVHVGNNWHELRSSSGEVVFSEQEVLRRFGMEEQGHIRLGETSPNGRHLLLHLNQARSDWERIVVYDLEQRELRTGVLPRAVDNSGTVSFADDGRLMFWSPNANLDELRDNVPVTGYDWVEFGVDGEERIPDEAPRSMPPILRTLNDTRLYNTLPEQLRIESASPLERTATRRSERSNDTTVDRSSRDFKQSVFLGQHTAQVVQQHLADYLEIVDEDTGALQAFRPEAHGLPQGSVIGLRGNAEENSVSFYLSTVLGEWYSVELDIETMEATTKLEVQGRLNPEDYRVEEVYFSSTNGQDVPMLLISPRDTSRGKPQPTLMRVYGWGGIDINYHTALREEFYVYLEQGGTLALPAIR